MKNIITYPTGFMFPVKLICCFDFGSASSARNLCSHLKMLFEVVKMQ